MIKITGTTFITIDERINKSNDSKHYLIELRIKDEKKPLTSFFAYRNSKGKYGWFKPNNKNGNHMDMQLQIIKYLND